MRIDIFLARRFASFIPKKKDYYEILRVKPDCSQKEIKEAFVRLASELHPDTAKDLSTKTSSIFRRRSITDEFMQVKEAYDTLKVTEKRRLYDEERRNRSGEGGFLMEAKGISIKGNKIIGRSFTDRPFIYQHFVNPEEIYERERRKNWPLYGFLTMIVACILANIGYIHYLTNKDKKKVLKDI